MRKRIVPTFETLHERNPASSIQLMSGVLTIMGTEGADRILISRDAIGRIVVSESGHLSYFQNSQIQKIEVDTGAGNDLVSIAKSVTQPATITGTSGIKLFQAGGGPTTIIGGTGKNKLVGGAGANTIETSGGSNLVVGGTGSNSITAVAGQSTIQRVTPSDSITSNSTNNILVNYPTGTVAANGANTVLTQTDVQAILQRASQVSSSNNAIIAIVDRNGTILGVRVESGVDPAILDNTTSLTFAIDGAVSLARTAAYFSNDQAPLTSRTVGFISQSTITQREVDANPDIADQNSTAYGPGYVAPVESGGHYPPGIANTPEVDLFGIEHSNRDSSYNAGTYVVNGQEVPADRFNIDPNYVPAGQALVTPDSYGYVSGILPQAQNRGIATLPGGVPIYKDYGGSSRELVGGIGVFFPGKTGFATEENSSLSATYNPNKPDLSLQAEYIALAAVSSSFLGGTTPTLKTISSVPLENVTSLSQITNLQISLGGITLNIFGPGGVNGIYTLIGYGQTLGTSVAEGTDLKVDTGGDLYLSGKPVPSGWLVLPHNGVGITGAQAQQIIVNGINQANQTRSAIRLPLNSTAKMVLAVTDQEGNVVALYRMPDATVFSLDIAVAKARNVMYYDDPTQLQPIDQVPGIPAGTAFTNRTFRYLALPRFPSAVDGTPPGPFSIFNDGGSNLATGLTVGSPLPASAFQSVYGYDSFHPHTNFRQTANPKNQNGVVFFPGSSPLYQYWQGKSTLAGGFGVSGDGVDEDDLVSSVGVSSMPVPTNIVMADQTYYKGVRLPYSKYDRNATGGVVG